MTNSDLATVLANTLVDEGLSGPGGDAMTITAAVYYVSRAINRLAEAMERHNEVIETGLIPLLKNIDSSIDSIGAAIDRHA